MGIIELPGLLASVWTWLFIYHVIKQTQKKESIDQKAFNGRRGADKHRQLSGAGIVLHKFSRDHAASIVGLFLVANERTRTPEQFYQASLYESSFLSPRKLLSL